MKHLLFPLLCLFILGCQSPEKTKKEPFQKLTNSIEQYSHDAIKKGNLDALAVSIYRDGKIHHNYYGELEKNKGNKPNDSTLFEIASISKVFLGSLIAKAVLEDKLNLNDDIRMYIEGDYPNLEFQGTPITIKNLVTHTGGIDTPPKLKSVFGKMSSGYYENRAMNYTMSNLLDELKTVELSYEPGTNYSYSSVGCEMAAYVLERAYNIPYKTLLQDFFDEIGMKNSYLQDFDQHLDHLAVGYDKNNEAAPFNKNPLLGGSAGIITTLPDLTKFMTFQLESNNPLIKEATKILYKDDDDNTMGYLWQDLGVGQKEGFYYSKSGDSNGVQSILLICPDTNYGQIVIANNQTDAATNDWYSLFNKIEYDLIEYPKVNLWSSIESDFFKNTKEVSAQYLTLRKDTAQYFSMSSYLNSIGYDYLFQDQQNKAIKVFELAIASDPESANLYDSLGEAYYAAKDYEKALFNYEKSLELNPKNDNAKKYIDEITQLLKT